MFARLSLALVGWPHKIKYNVNIYIYIYKLEYLYTNVTGKLEDLNNSFDKYKLIYFEKSLNNIQN